MLVVLIILLLSLQDIFSSLGRTELAVISHELKKKQLGKKQECHDGLFSFFFFF